MADAASVASDSSYETVTELGDLPKYVSHKEEAISWTTHLVPGDCVLDTVNTPGPGAYQVHDPKSIGRDAGVEFGGKNIKRELTAVDDTYKAQLSNPGVGAYNVAMPAIKKGGSVRFSSSNRFWENRNLYMGKEAALMATDSPGPGQYELASSSFKAVNPLGPPHTFGAINHDQEYKTDSPGPAAYTGEKPKLYSPQFGFGVSNRGESNKTFPGEQFMSKGRLGPGPGANGKGHGDLEIAGGVLSTTKRPANDTLKFACHTPLTREEKRREAKLAKLKAKEEAVRLRREGPPVDFEGKVTPEVMKQLAKSKNYSWLRGTESPEEEAARKAAAKGKKGKKGAPGKSKLAGAGYVKCLDGCDKLAARPFKHSPQVSFGTGPRFDDAVYVPSCRSIRTDSPGPKYMPVDTNAIGKGPKMAFTTGKKMPMTPGEWSRRNNPGVGHYNLTDEAKVEEMALLAYEVMQYDEQAATLMAPGPQTEDGEQASAAKKGQGQGQAKGKGKGQGSKTAAVSPIKKARFVPSFSMKQLDKAIGATFVTETTAEQTASDEALQRPQVPGREDKKEEEEAAAGDAEQEEEEQEEIPGLQWPSVDAFVEAWGSVVGWSDNIQRQILSKLQVCGLSSMEKLSLAITSSHAAMKAAAAAETGQAAHAGQNGATKARPASASTAGGRSRKSSNMSSGSQGQDGQSVREINFLMTAKGFKKFAHLSLLKAEQLLRDPSAWINPAAGVIRSPLTRKPTSAPRMASSKSLRFLEGTGKQQQPHTAALRALSRSQSFKPVEKDADGAPPDPVIRPDTVATLRKTTLLQQSFKSMLKFKTQAPSPKFSMQSREVEYWKRYNGPGTTFMARDSPGPGEYELASSSFREANPLGPPHTFGATNHDQKYETASPGPLAYKAKVQPKHSPSFGFGASFRGEGNKVYAGAQFMSKGQLGPGMHLVHQPLQIGGGVISSSRRAVCDPLPKPAPSPFEKMASKRRKKEQERKVKVMKRKQRLAERDAAKRAAERAKKKGK